MPSIRAVNLTKTFAGRVCVDGLTITVEPGELYALLGDNGAGKTTTINMLTTLLSPDNGEFFICGYSGLKDAERAKQAFGVVSQDVAIYQELTAWENLAFVADLNGMSKRQSEERIKQLLLKAGIAERANDRAGELSMGMQRKLSISCAMLHEPRVLFMDEPTVGLDPASRRHIWKTLRNLQSHGVTIFLTTHYLEEAELLANRIGIIRQGKLVIEGNIAELKEKIQSIRSLTIRLAQQIDMRVLGDKIKHLAGKLGTEVKYDALRNTIFIAQPKEAELRQCLHLVLQWLDEEQIPFNKFATSEPNLEEVFLAVTKGAAVMDVDADDLDSHVE